jgi:hypothetical protein
MLRSHYEKDCPLQETTSRIAEPVGAVIKLGCRGDNDLALVIIGPRHRAVTIESSLLRVASASADCADGSCGSALPSASCGRGAVSMSDDRTL